MAAAHAHEAARNPAHSESLNVHEIRIEVDSQQPQVIFEARYIGFGLWLLHVMNSGSCTPQEHIVGPTTKMPMVCAVNLRTISKEVSISIAPPGLIHIQGDRLKTKLRQYM